MKQIFLTTPIYYVNDRPHLGGAYTTLATDTLARYWRRKLGEENVFFLTGTDENSQKTIEAAKKSRKNITEYLDEMSANWRKCWDDLDIQYDDFIRTTEERHKIFAKKFIQKMYDNGDIYKGNYEGLYCTGCEAFLKKTDLDEAGNCIYHKKAPDKVSEENYFFKLSKYQDQLAEIFAKNSEFLFPEIRKNEVVKFIQRGLEDVSISRENVEIGITLPWDENHKTYVWIEALINYLTSPISKSRENFLENMHHIVGKDIIKFHAIIWPAMLISAGYKLPQQIFAHGFFTVNGEKMSKSLGNVIYPEEIADKFGRETLRLGLLSAFEFGRDGEISREYFTDFYRTRLAGGVGNLFNRVIVLINKFLHGNYPQKFDRNFSRENLKKFNNLLEQKAVKKATDVFFEVVNEANLLLNDTQVWTLAKTDLPKADEIFAKLLQALFELTEMAEIILPDSAVKMKKMLGENKKVSEAIILFPQIA